MHTTTLPIFKKKKRFKKKKEWIMYVFFKNMTGKLKVKVFSFFMLTMPIFFVKIWAISNWEEIKIDTAQQFKTRCIERL